LREVGGFAAPVVRAGARVIPVPGDLGAVFPGGGVQRGAVVAVDGSPGAGATTLVFRLAAAATAAGEWAALVERDATLGGQAAFEAGVALERCAVVRWVPRNTWATVVAALLDGLGLVAAEVPFALRLADARRLAARARERGAVLVVSGPWPAEAALRLHARGWADDTLRVEVDGRGAAARPRLTALAG
jgi:RecA/RadA recombinase